MEDVNRIIRALAGETSAQHVTRGWPLEEAAALVPLIVIRLASESCTARYDDQAYLMETEYELRVFARDPAQADTVAEEARLCMQALGYQRALLLPANPSKGRVIRRRIYTIGGTPLSRTLFRHDPEFPATTSDVVRLVGGGAPYITTHTRRKRLTEGITLGEVGSMEDLQWFVARFDAPDVVMAGSADLFQCLLEHHGKRAIARTPFAGLGNRRTLIVLGSTARHNLLEEPFFQRNRVALCPMPDEVFAGGSTETWIAEAHRLTAEADSLLLRIPQQISHNEGHALRLRHQMAETVLALVREGRFEEIVIEGGATAFTILHGLQWSELTIADEIAPGVVRLCHAASGTHLRFKPGSYPWGNCFC